jgi:hypothetical protein
MLLLVLACLSTAGQEPEPEPQSKAKTREITKVTGPFDYHNLAIYLVHGEGQLPGDVEISVLEPALEQKRLIVHETKNVNRLAVENHSDEYIFLQAGDIVRGGLQDRIIAYDLVVPPHSGKVKLGAFCVESGRWSGRGQEPEKVFNEATYAASGKELKRAYRSAKSQSEVWEEVQAVQANLEEALATNVRSRASSTSMALTLANQEVNQVRTRYTHTLMDAVDGKSEVIGFAYAVNGELSGANVYASSELFLKLWPKMLASAAVEAIGQRDGQDEFDWPTIEEVSKLLASPGGEGIKTKAHQRVEERRYDEAWGQRFESHDEDLGLLRTEILTDDRKN